MIEIGHYRYCLNEVKDDVIASVSLICYHTKVEAMLLLLCSLFLLLVSDQDLVFIEDFQ